MTPAPPPPPVERIHIHPVPVHQSTSGLMEEASVHSNTRHVRSKSRLPDVAGNSPRGENLATFFRANKDPPCFSDKCSRQARTEPFHTAHHSTGQRHSRAISRWTLTICTSNAGSIHTSQTGQKPGALWRNARSGLFRAPRRRHSMSGP